MPAGIIEFTTVIQGGSFRVEHYKKLFLKTQSTLLSYWVEHLPSGQNFPINVVWSVFPFQAPDMLTQASRMFFGLVSKIVLVLVISALEGTSSEASVEFYGVAVKLSCFGTVHYFFHFAPPTKGAASWTPPAAAAGWWVWLILQF